MHKGEQAWHRPLQIGSVSNSRQMNAQGKAVLSFARSCWNKKRRIRNTIVKGQVLKIIIQIEHED